MLLYSVKASKGVFFHDNNEASYEKERMISNKRVKIIKVWREQKDGARSISNERNMQKYFRDVC